MQRTLQPQEDDQAGVLRPLQVVHAQQDQSQSRKETQFTLQFLIKTPHSSFSENTQGGPKATDAQRHVGPAEALLRGVLVELRGEVRAGRAPDQRPLQGVPLRLRRVRIRRRREVDLQEARRRAREGLEGQEESVFLN